MLMAYVRSPLSSPCSERIQWEKEHGEYHGRQSRSPSPHGYHYHHGRQSACDHHVTVIYYYHAYTIVIMFRHIHVDV